MQTYVIEADMMGRTLVFKNKAEQMIAFAKKSTKALITSQARLPSLLPVLNLGIEHKLIALVEKIISRVNI